MPLSPALKRLTMTLAGFVVIAVLLPIGILPSQAAFVAQSANPGSVFSAAADFNTVSVALTNPGSPLRGSVTLNAVAASDRGITSVVFETSPAGAGTWTNACTDTVAPYSCTWDTTAVADGLRDVRAVATDTAGYTRTDTVTNRRVDNTAPTATTTDPGSPLTGTVTVAGTASDAGSGLASVTLQYRPTAGAWTDVCTQATSPISCSWNTASLADGLYDLRTVATDVAGNSQISAPVFNRRVDSTAPTATMTDPGTPVKGTLTLQSTSSDGAQGSGVASVRYEYKPSAGSTWTTACSSSTTPFSCSFNTTTATDGLYDFRAVATDGVAKTGTSAAVTSRRIDNTAPNGVTLGAVATPIQGTVALTGAAADAGSGLASLKFQYSPAGTGTWTDICTDTATPFTCSFDTTVAADALYDFRSLATDNAGNTTASAVQTNRRIDNNGPVVAITNPLAGRVRGTISVTGTATDPAGVANATFQYRQGAGAWQNFCAPDITAPYSCPGINTTGFADGSYDIRMQATDTLAHTTTSATTVIIVDNTAPTATDVQAANGGTLGGIDANDTLTFTWSEPMAPASILAGWAGGAQAIRVRVNRVGGANNDTLDLYNAAGTTRLNVMSAAQALRLNADYATSNPVWLNASMVMSGNTIVVTVGTLISGTPATGVTTAASMRWTSSNAATDAVGNPATGNTVTETGGADRDF
jgi:chitinase